MAAGPALTAFLGNNSQVLVSSISASLAQIKAGKAKPLALFGATRSKALPDVPTMKELGYNIEYYLWVGLFAPKGTPANVVTYLRTNVGKAVHTDQFKTAMANLGQELGYLDQPEFAKFWDADAATHRSRGQRHRPRAGITERTLRTFRMPRASPSGDRAAFVFDKNGRKNNRAIPKRLFGRKKWIAAVSSSARPHPQPRSRPDRHSRKRTFPSHAITIINAFPPGGINDIVTRPLAATMEPILKQPVVVETKAGAAGQVGAQVAATAKPDGYTLLSHNTGISGYAEVDKLFGRPVKTSRADFIPLARLIADPVLLLVNDQQPYKTLKEFIDDAKSAPRHDGLQFGRALWRHPSAAGLSGKGDRPVEAAATCRPMAAARPSPPSSATMRR